MRADRKRRLDSGTAERLIAGDRVEPNQLADLLSWAAGPARENELVGEEAATLAFRSARIHVPTRHRHRRPARRWTRLVSVKAVALGLAVAGAGMAFAAGAGVLPNPLHSPSPGNPATSTLDGNRPRVPGTTAATTSATASPLIRRLCERYIEKISPSEDQQSADKPGASPTKTRKPERTEKAYRPLGKHVPDPLSDAAGGADKVAGYCHDLEEQPPDAGHSDTGTLSTTNPATTQPSSSANEQQNAVTPTPHPTPSRSTPTHSSGSPPASTPGRP